MGHYDSCFEADNKSKNSHVIPVRVYQKKTYVDYHIVEKTAIPELV